VYFCPAMGITGAGMGWGAVNFSGSWSNLSLQRLAQKEYELPWYWL
jgi:hypothetical protein